jgi:hypothetical protein
MLSSARRYAFAISKRKRAEQQAKALVQSHREDIIEELFEDDNDLTEVKWFGDIMHREEIIG